MPPKQHSCNSPKAVHYAITVVHEHTDKNREVGRHAVHQIMRRAASVSCRRLGPTQSVAEIQNQYWRWNMT